MAYIITDDCINCGACKGECPVECISEGDTKHVIDADACIECGNCAQVCPCLLYTSSLSGGRHAAHAYAGA